ncbi:uncharacterized protein SPPG_02415 [Spizellomyces punctatus DAOM BR117]|uniref:Metallo-beta-lactamase domain-containing protein n=1 Tax=Spizellomyces punctatus (strain DAOM BR117) TaxID=645134 RepID=A0A0L0HPN8_SPIPD|nr:uncharacterized protein SPPG_02415 [Spizellomyces punctatus DAOM BR117]KND03371.1 hypothetical protein SPPG_02415 [Spizellomyces punctatus DAOM BR117]|eukprot:XP_016611410.1 hypothetical protein SPPG_02415 [Spizellomyces punctatus DAOM BR117]
MSTLLFGALLIGAFAIMVMLQGDPLSDYRRLFLTSSAGVRDEDTFFVTFFGVSSLLFTSGNSSILTDGYFSRPGKQKLFLSKIAPNPTVIKECLDRVDMAKKGLEAVVAMHSHFDHAMDSPEICRLTGAKLVGSSTTAFIGRGWNLSESQIQTITDDDEVVRFDNPDGSAWELLFVRTEHIELPSLLGFIAGNESPILTDPLVPPVRMGAYPVGDCYSLYITRIFKNGTKRTILVQGSAGYVPNLLSRPHLPKVDVVFLGVGGLGKKPVEYQEGYWREVVEATGAKLVIPVHWDDFTRPLTKPLQPPSRLLDRFDRTMTFLEEKANSTGVKIRLMDSWVKVALFDEVDSILSRKDM